MAKYNNVLYIATVKGGNTYGLDELEFCSKFFYTLHSIFSTPGPFQIVQVCVYWFLIVKCVLFSLPQKQFGVNYINQCFIMQDYINFAIKTHKGLTPMNKASTLEEVAKALSNLASHNDSSELKIGSSKKDCSG